jgi:hypothetical protein
MALCIHRARLCAHSTPLSNNSSVMTYVTTRRGSDLRSSFRGLRFGGQAFGLCFRPKTEDRRSDPNGTRPAERRLPACRIGSPDARLRTRWNYTTWRAHTPGRDAPESCGRDGRAPRGQTFGLRFGGQAFGLCFRPKTEDRRSDPNGRDGRAPRAPNPRSAGVPPAGSSGYDRRALAKKVEITPPGERNTPGRDAPESCGRDGRAPRAPNRGAQASRL